jgi:crotonobetainyl-CoA:carnitine CoA-transferase CaiB-like acyl-CoA transferase
LTVRVVGEDDALGGRARRVVREVARANGLFAAVEHPSLGKLEMLNLPIGLSETLPSIRATAPELGQHTEQILVDELGYSWEAISELGEKGVL